ncbi:MAG: class A beta-lactamase-related serine hydrolase [Candidatus Kapaibacterium sp.]|nr:MAG: class A beta-lactamase-related serine hydrolase [Candidatus Kapabacteria bacterium]
MNKNISLLLALVAFFLGTKGMAQTSQLSENQIAEVNTFVENLSNNDRFSGTVLIAKGNTILYQKAVGLADKERNVKNDINTKFNLASVNKMFTGIAIAQLVEKNKLRYSDKLVEHLPNLPKQTFGKITIEHLLTHTAGVGDIFGIPQFMVMKDTAKTIASYVALGINEPLMFEPGAKFQYSNYGYVLLGAVIEKIAMMSYFDYVKSNIFSVAGMENTDSYETDKPNNNMAIGYASPPPMPGQAPPAMGEKIVREANTKFIEVKGTSAGGGYSTALDLHRFSQALLAGKLLSQKNMKTVTTGKVKMPLPPMPPGVKPLPEIQYGYGFGEFYKNNTRIIGHNGGAPGVGAQIDIYPDAGYTVVVLANYERSVTPIINFIEEMIAAKP